MSNYEIRIYDPYFDLPFDQWDKEGFEKYIPQKVYEASSMSEFLSIWYRLESVFEGYPCCIIDIKPDICIAGGVFVIDDIDDIEVAKEILKHYVFEYEL